MPTSDEFWESAEQVETFAARAPDRRLLALLDAFERPEATRVLDLGCAGGRNTVVLAERGFDFCAIDASLAMVNKTRQRVAATVGAIEAQRRVRVGRMEDLGAKDMLPAAAGQAAHDYTPGRNDSTTRPPGD